MEELTLYIRDWGGEFKVEHLIRMAKNRASRGAKLPSITMVNQDGSPPEIGELSKLREYVVHVVCKAEDFGRPEWDYIPGGVVGASR